jgi:hypothetical protein
MHAEPLGAVREKVELGLVEPRKVGRLELARERGVIGLAPVERGCGAAEAARSGQRRTRRRKQTLESVHDHVPVEDVDRTISAPDRKRAV